MNHKISFTIAQDRGGWCPCEYDRRFIATGRVTLAFVGIEIPDGRRLCHVGVT